MSSIDDIPSCGQENDWRRARQVSTEHKLIDGPLTSIGNDAKIALMAAVLLEEDAFHNEADAMRVLQDKFPMVEIIVFEERARHLAWQESVVVREMSKP